MLLSRKRCGVQSHFLDNMFGWVRVLPDDDDD